MTSQTVNQITQTEGK